MFKLISVPRSCVFLILPAVSEIQVLLPECSLYPATTDQPLWIEGCDADTISPSSAKSSILLCANVSEQYTC